MKLKLYMDVQTHTHTYVTGAKESRIGIYPLMK